MTVGDRVTVTIGERHNLILMANIARVNIRPNGSVTYDLRPRRAGKRDNRRLTHTLLAAEEGLTWCRNWTRDARKALVVAATLRGT